MTEPQLQESDGDRWNKSAEPGRLTPRECIRNARDALNRAYSHPGITDASHALVFIAEAVDWQRRALEQMAGEDEDDV